MRAFELESFDPELYAKWRRHAGHVLLVGSGVGIILLAISAPTKTAALGIAGESVFVICGAAAALLMLIAKWRVSEVKHEFPGGKIIHFEFEPHPINSLVKALRQYVSLDSIERLTMMSSDVSLSDEYYNNGHGEEKPLVKILRDECPQAKVVVYGPSSVANYRPKSPQIEIIPTTGSLTKHTNLIVTKDGAAFIWYEPYHDMRGNRHIFTGGAYLIAIDKQIRADVERQYAALGRSSSSPPH